MRILHDFSFTSYDDSGRCMLLAYKIQYSPEDKRRYPGAKGKTNFRFGQWFLVLCVLAAVLLARQYGVPDFLIPGDPTVTREAASLMMDSLQSGSSLNEAVTVFCKEVLHGAGF